MKFRRSIKFNVWARFEAIVIAMLAFTYVCLLYTSDAADE